MFHYIDGFKTCFVTTTAVEPSFPVVMLYILRSSQHSLCAPKIQMLGQEPYCLAVHLCKQPHKHDKHISMWSNDTDALLNTRSTILCRCTLFNDKLLHTTIEPILQSLGWDGCIEKIQRRKFKKRKNITLLMFIAFICSEQEPCREPTSRDGTSPPWPVFLSYTVSVFLSLIHPKFIP